MKKYTKKNATGMAVRIKQAGYVEDFEAELTSESLANAVAKEAYKLWFQKITVKKVNNRFVISGRLEMPKDQCYHFRGFIKGYVYALGLR